MLQELLEALPVAAVLARDGRIVAANARYCALIGRGAAEILAMDPMQLIQAGDDRARMEPLRAAQLRGENLPEEFEVVAVHKDGTGIPVRVRAAPFPAGGPGATLLVVEPDRERSRTARLVRALVDAAAGLQKEDSEHAILRGAVDRLAALGLGATLCEYAQGRFRLLTGSANPMTEVLAAGGAGWFDAESLGLRSDPQARLIDDVPGLLAAASGRPRAQFQAAGSQHAVAAMVPVEGTAIYALAVLGEGLDSTFAGSFGLFCKQLGAALDTTRRLGELARKNRGLELINHVARATAVLGTAGALESALDATAEALALGSIAIHRLEEGALRLVVSRGPEAAGAAAGTRVPLDSPLPWTQAAATGDVIHFAQGAGRTVRQPPRSETPPHGLRPVDREAAGETGGHGVAVPLRISDRVLGVLLASRGAAFAADELALLSTIGAQIAVDLQNEELFEESRRRVSELSLLLELGQAVLGSLELPQILAEGARVASRLLRCSAAYVMLADPDAEHLVCVAAADPQAGGSLVGRKIPLGAASMSAAAFRTLEPQATSDPTAIDPALLADFACRSTLAVPLRLQEKPLGVLCLIERGEARAFTGQDSRLAMHAAQLISAAVGSAHLYGEERRRAEEMARLHELSKSLVGAVELKPVFEEAARTLTRLLDVSHCFIMLYETKDRELRFAAGPPQFEERLRSFRIPIDSHTSLAARVLRERRPVQITEAASSPLVLQELIRAFGEKSLLAIPLVARDEPLGVVVLDETRRERVFTPAEVERATAMAGQIALAILTARLYQDLRHSYAELARTQAELVERERLAVVGELSASIAHEVRNPLGVIFNSLGSLRRLLARPAPDVKLLLDIVGEEASRLNRMVDDLLDFSRPLAPAKAATPLGPLFEDALAAARAEAPSHPVDVRMEIQVETAPADGRLLRQALVNLFRNALQAMQRGGTLTVRAAPSALREHPAVLLAVRDSGPGIPREARSRIFQPFFTTRAQGTGLGLAVVRRIVEGHGGSISLADTPPGEGAEFLVVLPLD